MPSSAGGPGVWPRLDIHTHLAGIGHGTTGCFIDGGAFASPLYFLLRWSLGIHRAHRREVFDHSYRRRLGRELDQAVAADVLDGAVVFGHDRIHQDDGAPASRGQELYVPNEYVFQVCREYRGRGKLLPAISVHPYRADALAETERWLDEGAVAMKWLPNSQNIDPEDARSLRVCDLLAGRGVPLIVHTGGEHTVTVLRPEWGNPLPLRKALDRGLTVILAHCGTASGLQDGDWFREFRQLVQEYPHAFGDTSAFCSMGRTRWMGPLLEDAGLVAKVVHGSDFPIPPVAFPGWGRLGWRQCLSLNRIPDFLVRDVRIKEAWGFPPEVLRRGAQVLGRRALAGWGLETASQN